MENNDFTMIIIKNIFQNISIWVLKIVQHFCMYLALGLLQKNEHSANFQQLSVVSKKKCQNLWFRIHSN